VSEKHSMKYVVQAALTLLLATRPSGGPFGIEEAVRSGGAFCILLGLLVLPLVFSIPEAAMTAELGSAYPEAAGGVAWVEAAFGTQAGWIAGFVGWVSGATDTAIYPLLFLDYLLEVVPGDEIHPWFHYALVASFAIVLSYVTYRGLPVVSELSMVICAISMSPFILIIIIGVWKVEPSRWFTLPEATAVGDNTSSGMISSGALGGVLWRPFLNNMFWKLNSFDSASCFSGEVNDPGRSFPRAMFWSVILVVGSYFLPLLIILGASEAPQSAWEDGYLATAMSDLVGPWLGDWTVFAAGISNIALFQAEMAADAFQVMGMADRGYVPKIFSTRSRYETPSYGILLGLVIVLTMVVGDISSIIEMLNFNYAMYVMCCICLLPFLCQRANVSRAIVAHLYSSLLMEYAAFLKLRISKPEVPRPYRIPLSTVGCFIALTPTFAATLLVMALADFYTLGFSLLSIVVAAVIFRVRQPLEKWSCGYTSVPTYLGDMDSESLPNIT
jgi:amino acid transporter